MRMTEGLLNQARMALVAVCLWTTAASHAQSSTDAWLQDAYDAAAQASMDFRAVVVSNDVNLPAWRVFSEWDAVVDAWDDFEARVESARLDQLSYDPVFDSFQASVPIRVANTGWWAASTLDQVLSDYERVDLLGSVESQYDEFIEWYETTAVFPDGIDLGDLDQVILRRSLVLIEQSFILQFLGEEAEALALLTEAEMLLQDTITGILDDGVGEDGRYQSRSLGALTRSFLGLVRDLDGDEAFAEAAFESMDWLQLMSEEDQFDRSSITLIREVAQELVNDDDQLARANELANLVRTAEQERSGDELANSHNNIAAYLISIKVAVAFGDLQRAADLLASVEAIDGIDLGYLQKIQRIRALVVAEMQESTGTGALLALIDELNALIASASAEDDEAPATRAREIQFRRTSTADVDVDDVPAIESVPETADDAEPDVSTSDSETGFPAWWIWLPVGGLIAVGVFVVRRR